METKITLKTVGYALCAALLVGMLIGSALTWKCGKQREVRVEVVNPMIALQFDQMLNAQIKLRKDLQDMYKTWRFTTAKGETAYVDSTTPWADVPIIDTEFDTAFVVKVDDKPLSIGIHGILTTKGPPINLILRPHKTSYSVMITEKKPWVDPFLMVGFYVNYLKQVSSEVSGGFVFFDHYALTGKAELDCDMKSNLKLGVGWVF